MNESLAMAFSVFFSIFLLLFVCAVILPVTLLGFCLVRLRRCRERGESCRGVVFFTICAEIVNAIFIFVMIYTPVMSPEPNPFEIWLLTFTFGAFQFAVFGMPLFNLVFGLIWIGVSKKKKGTIDKKHFVIWLVAEIVLIGVSLLIISQTGLPETIRTGFR